MNFEQAYLDLLKKVLTASIYDESAWLVLEEKTFGPLRNTILKALRKRALFLVKKQPYNAQAREQGEDWPMMGFSMIGLKRLDNIEECLEKVIMDDIPGDFVECGVWRGGASIFARAVLQAYDIKNRTVWLADSFEGMPKIISATDRLDPDLSRRDYLKVSLEEVTENFRKFNLLDDQVQILKGWFADTLPKAPIERIAVLRLDGDHYSSTMDALTNLYDKVSPGGYVIVDDYNSWQGCKAAVSEFRANRKIKMPLVPIDRMSVYWQV